MPRNQPGPPLVATPGSGEGPWAEGAVAEGVGVEAHVSAYTAHTDTPCFTCSNSQGYFCSKPWHEGGGDDDLERNDRWLLKKAWRQVIDHFEFIDEWYDEQQTKLSGVCVRTLLSGGSFFLGKRCLREVGREDLKADDSKAQTRKYSVITRVNRCYLALMHHAWEAAEDGDDGARACLILEVASDIVIHETVHSCGEGEEVAYLLASYYRARFLEETGYEHAYCLQQPFLGSYDPEVLAEEEPGFREILEQHVFTFEQALGERDCSAGPP